MKLVVKGQLLRAMLALAALSTSTLILEAGRRW